MDGSADGSSPLKRHKARMHFRFLRQKRDQRQMTVGKTTQTASFISTYLPLHPVIDAQAP